MPQLPRRPPDPLAVRALVCTFALLAELAIPQPAHAAELLAVATVDQTIANITKWIVGLLAGLATLFLTVGGLRYLMAGGDPGEVEKAKGALRSAALGYMLAILAPALVAVLKQIVGA
ncbi:pilin [Streptacidiphilus sp. MAP5-3]|uniref:pilin n=1 Tax=unclassified Streptacidiphilus TaxID=2643834 RepID=UPI00351273C4